MKVEHNSRGFEYLVGCDIKQSSAVGDYEDSFDKPGSSFLWIDDESFNRENVRDLLDAEFIPEDAIPHVEAWLKTGSLEITELEFDVHPWTHVVLCEDEETGECGIQLHSETKKTAMCVLNREELLGLGRMCLKLGGAHE